MNRVVAEISSKFPEAQFIDVKGHLLPLELTGIKKLNLEQGVAFPYPKGQVSIEGPDAKSFLQGLITASMTELSADNKLMRSLISDNKGHILFDIIVEARGLNHYVVYCEPGEESQLYENLDFYKFSEDLEIKILDGAYLWYQFGKIIPTKKSAGLFLQQHSLTIHSSQSSVELEGSQLIGISEFDQIRVIYGFARSGVDFDASYLPAEASLESNVSFLKGCFIGQEPIARMEHKGRATKKIFTFTHSQPFEELGEIKYGNQRLGKITSTSSLNHQGNFYSLGTCKTMIFDSSFVPADLTHQNIQLSKL